MFTEKSRRKYLRLPCYLIPYWNSSSSCFYSLHKTQIHPTSQTQILPPVPKKTDFTISAHGHTWQDPYHWMSKTDDPDFLDYLHQENSYSDAFMADTQHIQRYLNDQITSQEPSALSTFPTLHGSWLYSERIPKGKEYTVISRKLAAEWGYSLSKNIIDFAKKVWVSEQILLDLNQIAEQQGYVDLYEWYPSTDNRYLAYTLDATGDERCRLQIRDLQKNCILVKEINNVVNFVWAKDSCSLLYTVFEENHSQFYGYKVQLTKLGSDDDDVIIYTEKDPRYCVELSCTKDGEYVTVYSSSRTSSYDVQVYVIDADKPLGGLRIIHKRAPGVSCYLEHNHGFFYIMTNAPIGDNGLTSANLYLARCLVEDVESNIWQVIIPPSEDVILQDIEMFAEHMVLIVYKNGRHRICSINLLPIDIDSKKHIKNINNLDPWYFPVPSRSWTFDRPDHYDLNFTSSIYRAKVSLPMISHASLEYDMYRRKSNFDYVDDEEGISSDDESEEVFWSDDEDGEVSSLSDDECSEEGELMDFSDEYALDNKEVISHDGIRVPLTIMYSRKMYEKGKSPGLLHGYGAFGDDCSDKDWDHLQVCLLDAGWVFAFADVRGGSSADPCWHENGSGMSKINSIKDFVACGEYLINEGYVHEHRLGARGASAGGLLVGAAINMSPHLFRATILKVPLLDVCNSLLDPNLATSSTNYVEFGNPELKSEFEYIMSYSPYNNIREGVCYPSMLVISAFNDARVGVWEAAKWVAKIRESTLTNCGSVILKTSMAAGHLGEGGCFGLSREQAFEYAFLLKVLGVCDVQN